MSSPILREGSPGSQPEKISLLVVLENSAAYLFSDDLGDPIELTGYSGHLTAAAFSASDETLITAIRRQEIPGMGYR